MTLSLHELDALLEEYVDMMNEMTTGKRRMKITDSDHEALERFRRMP